MAKRTDGTRVTLGGRQFVVATETTIEMDAWMMKRVRQGGLHDITIEPGEAVGDFADRILGQMIVSGVANELLGGLLLNERMTPQQWTPEHAEANALFISKLSDEADKETHRKLMVSALYAFFRSGLMRLNRGGSYSTEPARVSPTDSRREVGSANGSG